MIYFKNASGEVFAYETVLEREEFGAADLTEMTAEEVDAFLNPPAVPLTRDEVESARLHAYSNQLTGSDRLFAEASRMQLMGEPDFEAVRASAIARYQEIQAANPWPDQ